MPDAHPWPVRVRLRRHGVPHPAAIRARIDEALAAKETGAERVILFNYCGHGFPDLSAYDDYLNGRLPDEQG